jgi:phage terminase small subunit
MPGANFNRKNASAYVPQLHELTELQRRFCEEFLIDLNPRQAAIRAGYPPDKAAYAASVVQKHPPARDYIAKCMAQRSARVGLSAERVLDHLGKMIFADTRALFTPSGELRNMHDLSADEACIIAGIKTSRRVTMGEDGKMAPEEIVELKTVDNVALTTLAMKHLGMLNDKLDVNVTHTLADRLSAAYKRVGDKVGGAGPVIDGVFVEDVAESLRNLEQDTNEIQNRLTHDALAAPAALSLEDLF